MPPLPTVSSDLPAPLQATLQLIAGKPDAESSQQLLQFAASFAHPDYVCNLAMLGALPAEHKAAAREMFDFALTSEFTLEHQVALLHFVHPYLMLGPRVAPNR